MITVVGQAVGAKRYQEAKRYAKNFIFLIMGAQFSHLFSDAGISAAHYRLLPCGQNRRRS